MEDPDGLARLRAPKLALQNLRGLVVIDEIQRSPELIPGQWRNGVAGTFLPSCLWELSGKLVVVLSRRPS